MIRGPAADGRAREARWPLVIVFALFLGVLAANQVFHEAWRDELHSYAIARSGDSLGDLRAHARYEPHPGLWYLVLYAGLRIWSDPGLLKALAFVLGAVSGWLILFRAPFRPLWRALLAFGYFTLWEYGTISRSYSLGFCLFLGVMALFPWGGRRLWWAAALVVLLCQTSVFGGVLGCGLAVSILARRAEELGAWRRLARDGRARAAAAICLAGLALMLWQLRVPSGSRYDYGIPLTAKGAGRALAYTWDVLAPLPAAGVQFWGKNALADLLPPWGQFARIPLGLAAAATGFWALRRRPAAWTLFVATAGGVWLLVMKEPGGLRHHGHLLMAFLGAFWILAWGERDRLQAGPNGQVPATPEDSALAFGSRRNEPGKVSLGTRLGWVLFAAVCVFQCLCGVHASVLDWIYPFSGSAEAAELVRREVPADARVIAHMDFAGAAVAARLNRPFHYPASGTRGIHVDFNESRLRPVTLESVAELARQWAAETNRPVYVLLNREGTGPPSFPTGRLVGQTSQTAIQSDEVYYLYVVAP